MNRIQKLELECDSGTEFRIEPFGFRYISTSINKVTIEYKYRIDKDSKEVWPMIDYSKDKPLWIFLDFDGVRVFVDGKLVYEAW